MSDMDNPEVKLLGKLLGEIYRVQNKLGISNVDDATVYGLKNGIEESIEKELERIGFISNRKLNHIRDVLDEIWLDSDKMSNFKGFYDIERKLAEGGVDRSTAIIALTYLKADNRFVDVIEKMDTSGSPSECRTFNLREGEV